MKLPAMLCASVMALAAITMSAGGAFAGAYSTTKSNTHGTSGEATAPHTGSGTTGHVKPQGVQSKPRYKLHLKHPKVTKTKSVYHY